MLYTPRQVTGVPVDEFLYLDEGGPAAIEDITSDKFTDAQKAIFCFRALDYFTEQLNG